MPTIALRLLGAFSLTLDGAPLEGLAQPRLQALVAYLALRRRAPVPRAQLAAALWPETADEQALKNLRTLLARLRAALPGAAAYIAADAQTVQWRCDPSCALDVAAFEDALARAAARDPQAARAALEALTVAADLYAGDLLPGRHDEWLLPERERLRAAWLAALEELAARHEAAGNPRAALAAAQRLLRADPLHEAACAAAMRAQLALGDRAGALRTYHACAALLRDELGVDPGPATQAVYERVLMADEQPVSSDQFSVNSEQATVSSEQSRPRAQSPISTLQSPPLIGRANELAWLQARWQEAASGAAQVALVAGEAGIGKTRLAEELLAWVERQDAPADIAAAHCYTGGQVAYAPVAEWLRSEAVGSRLRGADAAWRSEAARLLPELLADDPTLEPPGPMAEAWQRHRFQRGLVEAIVVRSVASPAAERSDAPPSMPLLLLLEDVQWADAETVEWLAFFINAAAEAGAPLLLLLTLRAEEAGEDSPLTTLRRTLQRTGRLHEIALHPLDAAETAALAAALSTAETDTTALATEVRAVDGAQQEVAEQAAQLFRDTEGNPLFIVETVRAGQEGGALPAPEAGDAALGLPPKVLATLRYRLGRLSGGAHALAEYAAVLGRAFRYDVLAAMHGGDQHEEALVRGLDELWRRGIVREQGADAYDFSHDKLRAVAYAGLSRARRRLLHRRAAAALERLHAADLNPVSVAIAAHCEAAGDLAAAIPHYRRAAEAAQAVYATSEAIRLYRHLLGNELAPLLSSADKCDLLLALFDILVMTGPNAAAEAVARAAIAEAAALDDLRLAWATCALARTFVEESNYDDVLPLLAQARASFEAAGERRGLLRVLALAGETHVWKGDPARGLEMAEARLALAAELGDRKKIADALTGVGAAHWQRGDQPAAVAVCKRALELATEIGYRPGVSEAANMIGLAIEDAADSDPDTATAVGAEAVRWFLYSAKVAEEIGERRAMTGRLVNMSYTFRLHGDYPRALALVARAAGEAIADGDVPDACRCLTHAGYTLFDLGRLAEVEALFKAIIPVYRQVRSPLFLIGMQNMLADVLVEQGRPDEAAAVLEDACDTLRDRKGVTFDAHDRGRQLAVSSVRVRVAQGILDVASAVAELNGLLPGAGRRQTTEIVYRRWQITGSEADRRAAATTLRETYVVLPFARIRTRYHELTGEWLPLPAPLPDVSALIPAVPDLDTLITGITALLPPLTSPT